MNILVDTSVWVNHLRSSDLHLTRLLQAEQVLMHVMVIGELACGGMDDRAKRLSDWRALPSVPEASTEDVLKYIEDRKLMSRGIGLVDAHLLYAVETGGNTKLWTVDRSLRSIAEELAIDYTVNP